MDDKMYTHCEKKKKGGKKKEEMGCSFGCPNMKEKDN